MWKRLAIDVVLVILIAAAVGILKGESSPLSPPKEGITKADSSQNGKQQTEAAQNQKTPIELTSADIDEGPAPCDEACQQGRRNLEIQRKLQWFTGALALVGVLQVGTMTWQAILLYLTRRDIHTQAGYMERQTKILEDSVAAAKASAKAANDQIEMMREKERARIHIIPLDCGSIEPTQANKITIEFLNIGPTSAFEFRVEAGARVAVEGLKREDGEYTDLALPTLLKPDKTESSWVVWDFPRRWQSEVLEEKVKITLEVAGQIKYRDIFDYVHTEEFSYRMIAYGIEHLPGSITKLKLMRDWHPFDLRPHDWNF